MKLLPSTAIALALLIGLGFTAAPQEEAGAQETEQKTDDGARLAALEAEVAALKVQIAEQAALVDATAAYLAGAESRSQALLQTFDAAEEAGFTAGINFRSREILLGGLRAYANGEAKGVPSAKKPADADEE